MKGIVCLSLCLLAVLVPIKAQFNIPYDGDCSGNRLLDPFLVQALKSKFPKKFNSKLDLGKDMALGKLKTANLLARHMKNFNALNYDLQNLIYQQQQQALMHQLTPEQTSILAQQQFANVQNPFDTSRNIYGPQIDASQLASYQPLVDQRYQQPTFQLTAAQSNHCTQQEECPCSCEEEPKVNNRLPDALSAVVSTCLGVLKNIFK